jgi:hypothetical protein
MGSGHLAAAEELTKVYESDRAVAILGASLLDHSLDVVLRSRMRAQTGKLDVNEKLFRVNGPLGNLGPKIDLGYQLYVFEKMTRNAMYGITEIRNFFGHRMEMSFDSDDAGFKAAIEKLKLHEGRTHYPHPLPFAAGGTEKPELDRINSNKDRFMVNLRLCLIELFKDHRRHQVDCNFPINYGPLFDEDGRDERLP